MSYEKTSSGLIYVKWESLKEKTKRESGEIFEDIMGTTFPDVVQECQVSMNHKHKKDKENKSKPRNIIIKLFKTNDKDKNLQRNGGGGREELFTKDQKNENNASSETAKYDL